jgi:L-ascorbate metabolism protein UlaG (beta-lactamase superfamily)
LASTHAADRRVQLTRLGHSCVLIEAFPAGAPGHRLLLDPGNLTPPLTGLGGIDSILITHAHPDHADPAQIARIREAGATPVYGPADAVAMMADAGLDGGTVVGPGTLDLGPLRIGVSAVRHETICPGIQLPDSLAFDIDSLIFAPGDSFAPPPCPADLLLAPAGAPWMKLAETIEYIREVRPPRVIPVHDAGLAPAHQTLHRNLIVKFAPEGTAVHTPSIGETIQL